MIEAIDSQRRRAGSLNIGQSQAVMASSSAVVGALSYACTLVLAHVLSPQGYIDFNTAQALLTMVGIAASSLVPLPLARLVRAHPAGSHERRKATAFAVGLSVSAGVAAGLAMTLIMLSFTGVVVAVATGIAGLALVVITPTWGWLQGELRFGRFAVLSIAEVALRVVFSMAAVGLGWGAGGPIVGWAVGALVVLVCAVWWMRRDFAWQPTVLKERNRWTETAGVALVQLVTSGLIAADIIFIAIITPNSPETAGYQAVSTIAKAAIYIATGTVLLSFPLIHTADDTMRPALIRSLLDSFYRMGIPAAAIVATVPAPLALLVLPTKYADSLSALPWLAAASIGLGTIMITSIILLACRAYQQLRIRLTIAATILLGGLLAGWKLAAVDGLAKGVAVGAVAAAVVMFFGIRRLMSPRPIQQTVQDVVVVALLVGVLSFLRTYVWLWLPFAVLVGLLALLRVRRHTGKHGTASAQALGSSEHLQILHLGFEDPAAPGAGGGSLRTHEINRRLVARGHRVTVLTTRFPGCIDRIQDGVAYIHVGIGRGRTRLGRFLGYVCMLPLATRRRPAHLVVEDFFAPISSLAAPLWTGRPTIGVVQWLNAREKSRQYHVPVQLVERFGVRRHRQLIAVSQGIADELAAMNPSAAVNVIGNGVAEAAFTVTGIRGQDIVFVGRLEVAQKGLDLLLQAWAQAAPQLSGQLVIIGIGPDEARLRALVAEWGLADRVRFVGWLTGRSKYLLMADARVVVVPSRFETFGIVALEALAAGTPILTFDIPCLREVVPAGLGAVVPSFDVNGYAAALVTLYHDMQIQGRARVRGPEFAARYNWDAFAVQQEKIYYQQLAAVGGDFPCRRGVAEDSPSRHRHVPVLPSSNELSSTNAGAFS